MAQTNDEQYLSELISTIENFYNSILSIKNFQIDIDEENPNKKTLYKVDDEIRFFRKALKYFTSDTEVYDASKEDKQVNFYYSNLQKRYDEEKDGHTIFSDNPFVASAIQKYNLFNDKIKSIQQQNLNLALMNITSSFEVLISKLLEYNLLYVYKEASDLSKKTVKYEDIIQFNSIDDIKRKVVDEYIDSCLYKRVEEWMDDVLGICVYGKDTQKKLNKNEQLKDWIGKLNELYQRRNLIAHSNSVVNYLYFDKVGDKFIDDKAKIGEKLETTKEYLVEMCDVVNSLGFFVITENIKCKKLYQNQFFYDNTENISLELLRTGKQEIAIMMHSARVHHWEHTELTETKDLARHFIAKFNYWLCYKLGGNESEVIAEIEEYKADNYDKAHILHLGNAKLGLSSLLDTEEEFTKYAIDFLKEIDDKNRLVNILEWPLFKIIENQESFIEFKEQLYYDNK